MPFDVEIHFNAGHIQDALRYATKDLLHHMITNMENEPPDNDGGNRAPKGFIRHADGHLSPDFDSSDYPWTRENPALQGWDESRLVSNQSFLLNWSHS